MGVARHDVEPGHRQHRLRHLHLRLLFRGGPKALWNGGSNVALHTMASSMLRPPRVRSSTAMPVQEGHSRTSPSVDCNGMPCVTYVDEAISHCSLHSYGLP